MEGTRVADLQSIARDVIRELDDRFKNCFSDLNRVLAKCFDFARLIAGVCGTRSEGRIPVDKKRFSEQGAKEFRKCVNYVSQMPRVKDENLELGSKLSSAVFWRFKKALIEVVWGDLFSSHFSRFFKKIVEKANGNFSSEILVIPNGVKIKSFVKSSSPQFPYPRWFKAEFTNSEKMKILFDEQIFIESLYTDSPFYSVVGQEFCLVFDIFYAKSGTEVVAESFYRVVEKQEMEGGQSLGVLMDRAKIDWCLPPVIQCESALMEIAKLYINGDKELGFTQHFIPLYKDQRSWQKTPGRNVQSFEPNF